MNSNDVFQQVLKSLGAEKPSYIFVYGEAGSGKTNLATWISSTAIALGYKVFYLSSEGELFIDRILNFCEHMENQCMLDMLHSSIVMDFYDQAQELLHLYSRVSRSENDRVLVVIDSINGLFREIAEREEALRVLAYQSSILRALTSLGITTIATGQVRAYEENEIDASGAKYISWWATHIYRLQRLEGGLREMLLLKPCCMRKLLEIHSDKLVIVDGEVSDDQLA